MKRIILSLCFMVYCVSAHAQDETLTLLTYYPAPYGVYTTVKIYNSNESTTQTNFTQSLTSAGLNIETDYTANAYTPGIFWSTQNNNPTKPKAGIYLMETDTGTNMLFGTSNSYATGITNTAIAINPAGNVGIGTVNPTSILALGGDSWRIIKMERKTFSDGGSPLEIKAGGAFSGGTNLLGGDLYLKSGISTGDKGSRIHFSTATPGATGAIDHEPNIKMVITGQGNVGIGNVNPDRILHVMRDVDDGTYIKIENNDIGGNSSEGIIFDDENGEVAGIYLFDDGNASYAREMRIFNNRPSGLITFSTQGAEKVRIANNGNVGIGRSPTANKLEVAGTASKAVAGSWLANSDIRIKTDIHDLDNALSTIKKIHPVKFRYKDEYRMKHESIEDRYYCNFIAQEYKEVFPESVKDDGEGYLQIDTYNVRPYLVAAVQELSREMDRLKAENDILKEKNSELEARIKTLEEKLQ